MQVLMVAPDLPYPLDGGGRIRMYHIVRGLYAAGHVVDLISINDRYVNDDDLIPLQRYCRTIRQVHRPTGRLQTAVDVMKAFMGARPYMNVKISRRDLVEAVERAVSNVSYDAVLGEQEYIVDALKGVRDIPVVLDMHDINSVLYRRSASTLRWGLKRIHSAVQCRIVQRYEKKISQLVRACTVVSEADAAAYQMLTGRSEVRVVPNGVDVEYFNPIHAVDSPIHTFDLVFSGSMDYHPNVDGATFLVREVMPLIWKERPSTTLAIVGRNPTSRIQALGTDPRVTVTGAVPDIRPYLQGAGVVMVTVRVGGGTRLKALEAAAMAKPIVGTPVGLEGVGFTHGRDAMFAEGPAEIADVTLALIQRPDLRRALGKMGRELVVACYSWDRCVDPLNQVLEEITRAK